MNDKILLTLVVMLGSAAIIAARRWRNDDMNVGYGVTALALLFVWCIW